MGQIRRSAKQEVHQFLGGERNNQFLDGQNLRTEEEHHRQAHCIEHFFAHLSRSDHG